MAGKSGEDEVVEGILERVVFQSPETHFTVARLTVEGRPQPLTIVGTLVGVEPGTALRVRGKVEVDKKWGEQLKMVTYTTLAPATKLGIEKFLGSGMVPGIGAEMARRLVDAFGLDTLKVAENEPQRLREVEGIGELRAKRISESLREQRAVQDVMVFLQGHGVSPAFAARIFKAYGPRAIAIVRENPYRLALDVWGIGFKTADAIARSLGIGATSPARAEAGLLHLLGGHTEDGHCHVPEHELVAGAEKELGVGREILEPAIERLVGSGRVARETLGDRGECLAIAALRDAEVAVAKALGRLGAGKGSIAWADGAPPPDVCLAEFEQDRALTLATRQREAVLASAREPILVVTGGPGTGKTTIVQGILALAARRGARVGLAAPTGRAAKRLSETTGRPAATIHRLLEFQPQTGRFARDATQPLEVDLLVVDEASMLDVPLAAALLDAIPTGAQLVLVGDVDQLPSVGPGRVLGDVIGSRVIPVVTLGEIFRQAARSAIVVAAHKVNAGELPELAPREGSDFYFIERDEPAEVLATVTEVVAERIPRRFKLDPLADVQVLTPMHRGEVGAKSLNEALQTRLNPAAALTPELVRGARTFRRGDRVIQLKNDYDREVYNGDVGRITEIDLEGGGLMVEIDGRAVAYEPTMLDQLQHAYALSVHKSQGSEYPAIVLPLTTQHFMMLQRNLVYTAITRGRKLVVIVGSKKALGLAIRNDDGLRRWTWLAERLRAVSSGRAP